MTTKTQPTKQTKTPKMGHHKPTGQAYVRLNGQMLYLGSWGRPQTTQRYHREIAEWIQRGRCPKVTPSEMTVMELCSKYLDYAQVYYVKDGAATSELMRVKLVLKALKDTYGTRPAAEFGPNALRTVRQTWIDKGLSRTTINGLNQLVKRVFKWGASHELLPGSVHHALVTVEGLTMGRSEAREPEPIAPVPDEYVTMTKEHVSPQVATLIDLQLLTAARSGELLQLRPMDFDTTGLVWTVEVKAHKTAHHGKRRVLCFGPQAQKLLRPWMLRSSDAYLFSPREAEAERRTAEAVSPRRPNQAPSPRKTDRTLGDCYTVHSYRRAIDRAVRKVNAERVKAGLEKIPSWHPHQLRHNAATRIRRQHGLDAAQAILGHSRANTTEIYAEVNHLKALEIAGQMG